METVYQVIFNISVPNNISYNEIMEYLEFKLQRFSSMSDNNQLSDTDLSELKPQYLSVHEL